MCENVSEDFRPSMTQDEFLAQLRSAGFTEKTIAALGDEDINSDAALRILSVSDIETLAKEKQLSIGQKRLLIEFAAKLNPKKKEEEAFPTRSAYSKGGNRSAPFPPSATRGGYNRKRMQERLNPAESNCVCVFNLSPSTQEFTIYDFFSRLGYVKDVKIVYDRSTGCSRGFAFVHFADVATAKYAKETGQGMLIDGQQIRIDFSLTKRGYSPTGHQGKSSAPY